MSLKIRKIIGIILTIIVLVHPLFIYFGLKMYSSRLIAFLIGVSMLGHVLTQDRHALQLRLLIPFSVIVAVCVAGILLDSPIFILYLPCCICASLLVAFSHSLFYPPSTIEVFARMFVSELSSEEMRYCRRVTLIWIGFFLLNGVAAFYTACCATLGIWSLYNGLLAYVGMGMLFVAELSYRSWRFRRYAGLPTDFIFKKLFPPKA
jgi:uncharacterized membrane protein